MKESELNENETNENLKESKYIEEYDCQKYKKKEIDEVNKIYTNTTVDTNGKENNERNNNQENQNVKYPKGRKKKNDHSIRINNKYCDKNINKKIRTKYHKFLIKHLIRLMKKYSIKKKIYPIKSSLVINIKNNNVLKLYNMNIKEFFSQSITEKASKKKSNEKVLKELLKYDEIQKFLEKNYLKVFYELFLMKSDEYIKTYNFENSFLFENIKIDNIERKKWIQVINTKPHKVKTNEMNDSKDKNANKDKYGLYNYYKKKHERGENNNDIDNHNDTNIKIKEDETNNEIKKEKAYHLYLIIKLKELVINNLVLHSNKN